jgi:orotidine-5'-phosphate decarboxylase
VLSNGFRHSTLDIFAYPAISGNAYWHARADARYDRSRNRIRAARRGLFVEAGRIVATKRVAHFAERLIDAVRRRATPVLVGLDPRWEQLPDCVRQQTKSKAAAYRVFCEGVIDAIAELAPAVKPQAAFFEQLGPPGMSVLRQVVRHAQQRGLLVIIDGKRGDIGSTASAYAEAYLGHGRKSPWGGDALTVNPYLGDDSLEPFVSVAKARGAGVFVLVKTSNPGSKTFQDLAADGRAVYRHVAEHVESLARQTAGSDGYGVVGAVVGATHRQQAAELRAAMPHAWFLVPGYGSQGAKASDVAGTFDKRGLGAIVNSSRAIIFAHERPEYARFGSSRWQEAVATATRDMIAELRAETPAGRLAGG